MKHMWNIAAKKDSLWVKWISVERLKGMNIWQISIEANCRCIWKSLLELRNKVKNHIGYKIGDCKKISAWHEKWHEHGPLSQYISQREIYNARLSSDNSIAEVVENGNWKWPTEWYIKYPILNNINVPVLDNYMEQRIVWVNNYGNQVDFYMVG